MQKNFKEDFEKRYNKIFKNLYVQWKLQSKMKYEELQKKGLAKSGSGSRDMYILIEQLANQATDDLKKLFMTIPEKYNRKIPLKNLEEYEIKTKNNICGHIDNMQKDIEKIYNEDKLLISESNKIFFNNIKSNLILNVEEISQEIKNLRKGKKVEGLVIFNIIFTLLSFAVGVASLIVGVISIIK